MPSSSSTERSPGAGVHDSRGGGGGGPGDDGGGGDGGGGGKLVKVAFARNQAEAEMIQGLLGESGIPSILKRARGFDAPEFMAAGPHDVFVSSDHARVARQLLAGTVLESEPEERAELEEQSRRARGEIGQTSAARLALWLGAAFLAAAFVVWVLYQVS